MFTNAVNTVSWSKCKVLRKLQLNGPSILENQYARLVAHLPNLEGIGRFDNIKYIVEYPYHHPFNNIKTLIIQELKTETLGLLVKYFPELERLSWNINDQTLDFSKLIHFSYLRKLKLFKKSLHSKGLYIRYAFLKHVLQQSEQSFVLVWLMIVYSLH